MRLVGWFFMVGIAALSACGSAPEATIAPPTVAITAILAPPPTMPATTPTPTTELTPAATVPPTTDVPARTAPTTGAPRSVPPATDAPSSRPTGSVPAPADSTAAPAPDGQAGTEPAPPGALVPAFFTFSVSDPGPCPDAASPEQQVDDVTVRWEVIGAESVDIAVDGTVVAAGLLPAGSLTLERPCPGPTTYRVIAENPDGRSTMDAAR